MGNTVHVITVPRANYKPGDIINVSDNLKLYYSNSDKYYKLFESQPKKLLSQIIVYGLQKVGSFIWYDDNAQYWFNHLRKSILSILYKYPESIIIATGSPFQACYQTMKVCEEINYKKYILDFQDPWSIDPYRTYPFNWMKKNVDRFESKTLLKSKNNIYVTTGLKNRMERLNQNSIVIENGHDFIEPIKNKKNTPDKKNKFIYLGTLANGRDIIFINFLNKIIIEKNLIFDLDVFGRCSRLFTNWVRNSKNININISFKDPIQRNEISFISQKYKYGLQLNSEDYPYLVSTKVYEYPALGLPVLSVNGGGEVEKIIKKNKIGISLNTKKTKDFNLKNIFFELDSTKMDDLNDFSIECSWLSRAHQINSYLIDTF